MVIDDLAVAPVESTAGRRVSGLCRVFEDLWERGRTV
jgi:hypothetical protein